MKRQRFTWWESRQIKNHDFFSVHLVPTLIIFLILMVLVGLSWRTAVRDIDSSRYEITDERSRFAEASVRQKMIQYENTLRAGVGLFEGSSSVDRDEWGRFVASLDIRDNFPGLLGLGYVQLISPSELNAYESVIRSEGFSSFSVTPRSPNQDIYSSITYIEPFDEENQRAFGYNLYSEPIRKLAMDRARDSGEPSMSDLVQLKQDQSNGLIPGLLLFQPMYRVGMPRDTIEQRRAAIFGYIFAPFRASELFNSIFKNDYKDINIQIFDGTDLSAAHLLYEKTSDKTEDYEKVKDDEITVYDQLWILRYSIKDTIVPLSLRERPNAVAFGGILFSLVIATVVYLLLQKRTKVITDKEENKLQRAKDDMLSLASHQLRTPATGVKQYIGMVLEGFVGTIDDEQRDILSRAYESNERQLRIINEFLYLAKADADRIVVSPQKFDLIELTQNILDGMKTEIIDSEHKLKLIFPKKRLILLADPHSIRMIIENLISNAIKYTPAKGTIVITVKKQPGKSFISISDSGVGIKKNDLKHLFKQFSRIPNDLTKQTSGSGIGLYLARYLAQLNGGDITVQSEPEIGSTFTVTFPDKNVKNITA